MNLTSLRDLEGLVRGFLMNAAARAEAYDATAPSQPSVDYRSGYAAGRQDGEVAALALVAAAVDAAMPFELHWRDAS
jgi:hypothetical protein